MKREFRKILAMGLCLGLGLSLTACDQPAEGMKKAVKLTPEVEAAQLKQVELNQDYIDGTMRFSVDLLKGSVAECEDENQNVLVSPLSVQLALSITANGADGETLKEMQKVLTGCEANPDGLDMDTLNTQMESLMAQFAKETNANIVSAHSLWVNDNKLEVSDDYLNRISSYQAELYKAPFSDKTVDDINAWVNEKTNGYIPSIVDELSPEAVTCIMNTLLFEGEWSEIFYDDGKLDGTFTNASGDQQDVNMLYGEEYEYLENDNVTGFMKHYSAYDYAYVALLPKNGSATEYVNNLTCEELSALLNNVQSAGVRISMPAYKSNYKVALNDILKDMGIDSAFTPGADFTKLGSAADSEFYIGSVLHKTFIDVNKDGTTAAAATYEELAGAALIEKEVVLDRPFVYAIIDTKTNLPLFIGVLNSVE